MGASSYFQGSSSTTYHSTLSTSSKKNKLQQQKYKKMTIYLPISNVRAKGLIISCSQAKDHRLKRSSYFSILQGESLHLNDYLNFFYPSEREPIPKRSS